MGALYNDNDPHVCAWLRELIRRGLLPGGVVDERCITEIHPRDCAATSHFFAGIGGWAYALQLAQWPSTRAVWSASLPCQPFSVAGKGHGTDDERHLWAAFRRLVEECRPPTLFGEQTARKAGQVWLCGVRADLETLGYAVGAADLPAAGIGAPHIRQRLFWVAQAGGVGHTLQPRLEGQPGDGARGGQPRRVTAHEARSTWASGVPVPCDGGIERRAEPGTLPLADGIPNRMGRVRAYGAAIVPPLAAEFIMAFLDAEGDTCPS